MPYAGLQKNPSSITIITETVIMSSGIINAFPAYREVVFCKKD